MADLPNWSRTDSNNIDAPPDGAPEGMLRSDVNDTIRANMGGSRRAYEEPQWTNLLEEDDGFTVSKTNDTTINIVFDGSPARDATSKFPDDARIRLSVSGASIVEGFVTSSSYVDPNTSVIVDIDAAAVVPVGCNRAETHVTKASVERTAFYPPGPTTGQDPPQVPTADDLGTAAFKNEGTGSTLDADLLDGLEGATYIAAALIGANAVLLNGDAAIWQRGTTINASSEVVNDNNVYTADQWVLLQGSGTTHPAAGMGVVDLTRESVVVPEGIAAWAGKFTVNANIAVTSEKFAWIQWIENSRVRHFINQVVSLTMQVRHAGPGSLNLVQIAILEWIGAADTLTSTDPINDWGAGGVEPTVLANYAITSSVGAGGIVPTTSFQEIKLENITVSANMKNLAVMVWSDDESLAVGDILYVSGVTLSRGTTASAFAATQYDAELVLCERYYETTFDSDQEPQQNFGNADTALQSIGGNGNTVAHWRLREKLKDPTVTTYNPVVAASSFRNLQDNTNQAVTVVESGKSAVNILAVGNNRDDRMAIHAAAEAVL